MKKCNILYITKNQKHATAFEGRACNLLGDLKKVNASYNTEEDFIRHQAKSALYRDIKILSSFVVSEGVELESFLDSYDKKLSELYVIIDYVSFCDEKYNARINSIKIRELILKYPEINFAFDEHLLHKYNVQDISFVDFLIPSENLSIVDFKKEVFLNEGKEEDKEENKIKNLILKEMHTFDIDDKDGIDESTKKKTYNSILRFCYFNDNLFDASNLRFALKALKYQSINVDKRNFARIQLSRSKHLAFIVEEERSQSLFNCYATYASGFRCLPVTTAQELNWLNGLKTVPNLILRDYDLQFPDEAGKEDIHQIRGWRHKRGDVEIPWEPSLDGGNSYWSSLCQYDNLTRIPDAQKVYYISKGGERLKIRLQDSWGIKGSPNDNNNILILPGLEKPISGIYTSFAKILGEVYKDAIYTKKNSKHDFIDTKRRQGDHGVPLDIYYMVKSMVDRARLYFENKRYVHAAILAQEVIEVLNGFHEALLLQAYYILAVSENAIAMDIIGGDEDALRSDAMFRIHKIKYEIDRILRRTNKKENLLDNRRAFKYNVLNQIYSACRKSCKEKEHFKAEDCFISAMAHVNEGYTPYDMISEFVSVIKKALIDNLFICNKYYE